jgi:hypothetical protein
LDEFYSRLRGLSMKQVWYRQCGQYFKVWDSYRLSGYELGADVGQGYFCSAIQYGVQVGGILM